MEKAQYHAPVHELSTQEISLVEVGSQVFPSYTEASHEGLCGVGLMGFTGGLMAVGTNMSSSLPVVMGMLSWVITEYGLVWLGFTAIGAAEYMENILVDVIVA